MGWDSRNGKKRCETHQFDERVDVNSEANQCHAVYVSSLIVVSACPTISASYSGGNRRSRSTEADS